MAFAGDIARLIKLTREMLLREVLREFHGEEESVVNALRVERALRGLTDEQLEHCTLVNRDSCRCPVCSKINRSDRDDGADLRGSSTGMDWVGRMMVLIEKRAPGITPTELKRWMMFMRILRGRSRDELKHLARHRFFLTHTPEQAEAERQYFEWKASHPCEGG